VTTLSEQVVTAERNDVELAPERNSYAVKNMTSASGGTAVDALRNVPSVEVDGSNQISLRGNPNVVVQINGRTSPLRGEQLGNFLSQLPASTIARIEVATSPSAKEDPEGTAGILNLVLAQQVQGGVSGGVSFGTGTTGLANLSGNIGRQSGAWTLFSSLSGMRDARPFTGESARQSFATDPAFANAQNPIGSSLGEYIHHPAEARRCRSAVGQLGSPTRVMLLLSASSVCSPADCLPRVPSARSRETPRLSRRADSP
jgi:hypothetical protein